MLSPIAGAYKSFRGLFDVWRMLANGFQKPDIMGAKQFAMIRRSNEIAAEEKRQALEEMLESETFARADQLKFFLRYVCEMELAGRSSEISEYSVGVEALGRPKSFS